jgi:hypothetical protein
MESSLDRHFKRRAIMRGRGQPESKDHDTQRVWLIAGVSRPPLVVGYKEQEQFSNAR